jgi:type VI protein secretion system component VasF
MSAALQLYEPLLQYLCRVNRLARNGASLPYGEVRGQVMQLLAQAEVEAEDDPPLRDQCRALHTPVKYFVDDLIAQSPLPFAKRWHENRLGYEKDGLAGDEAFFDYLDRSLAEPPSPGLAERHLVYYVCLGLGFEGFYFNNPEKLRSYMKALMASVRPFLIDDTALRLVPQAYQFTDQRDFTRPPKVKRALLLGGAAALLSTGVPVYFWMADRIVQSEDKELRWIRESHQGDSIRSVP